MTDFASLVLSADSRGLVTGEQALDRFASTAERTETRAGKALEAVGKASEQVGKQGIYASQNLRLQAMQLSQVAQQASATGNVLQAIAIQLPDLALGFGPIGIAAGAAAGAALSYFSTLAGNADNSATILKEQEALIRRVAETWGEAVPALQAYIDQLDRAREVGELNDAIQIRTAKTIEEVRASVDAFNDANSDIVSFLVPASNAAGEQRTVVSDLGTAYLELFEKVQSGKATLEDFRNVQTLATNAAATTGVEELAAFASGFATLASSIFPAINALNQFNIQANEALGGAYTKLGGLSPLTSENGAFVFGENNSPLPFGGNIPTPTPRGTPELSGFPWEDFNRKRRGGGRRKSGFDRSLDEAHNDAVRIFNETRTEAEKYAKELERVDDLYKRGFINADTYNRAVDQLKEEYQETGEVGKFFAETLYDAFEEIIPQIETGNKALDTFLNTMIKAAAQGFLLGEGPLASLFGGGKGGGGGLLTRLFSFDGGGYTGDGARSGGLDGKGGYLAMLHPQEHVTDLTKGGGAATGVHVTFAADVDRSGNLRPFVTSIAKTAAKGSTTALAKQVPGMIDSRNKTSQTRKTRA